MTNLKKTSLISAGLLSLSLSAGASCWNADFMAPTLLSHKDHYELKIAAPGFEKKDIKIMLDQEGLLIKGEHKLEQNKDAIVFGNTSNYFEYFFPVGNQVLRDEVTSSLKDGLLTIKAKKDPKKAPKEILVM